MNKKSFHFKNVSLIGAGLIGGSLARVIKREGLADRVTAYSRRPETRERIRELGFVDSVADDIVTAVADADLVVVSVPVSASGSIAKAMGPHLRSGAIVTDTGSVKQAVIAAMGPHLPEQVHFVPGHPIAGTENTGPDSGFDTLFQGRWCVLTPPNGTDPEAVSAITNMWERAGSKVDLMSATHHDMVLAITSHIPHLLAFNIVGTVSELEEQLKLEVIKYSAGGFRDFTRIAASDPEMWRDIFIENKEAVLEMLGRFSEDLAALQRAIRWEDTDGLESKFSQTRDIRRDIIEAKQE
jgi:cyclohexadieny/prephenate dehydrogenase